MYSRNTQVDHEVTLLIEYMFQKNIFPEQELKLILNGITSLPSLCSLISVVIAKKDVTIINQLITRFEELASSKTSKELHESMKNIVNGILSHPDNNQAILQELVAHVTSKNKENLPDCLINALYRARLTHLEGVALKGKPEMSWNQLTSQMP